MNRTFFKICTLSALAWLSSSIAYAENSSIILVKDSTGSSLEKQAQYNSIESFTRKDNTSDWIKTKVTQADKSFQVLNNEDVLLNNEISFAWNFNEKISLSLNVFDNYLVSNEFGRGSDTFNSVNTKSLYFPGINKSLNIDSQNDLNLSSDFSRNFSGYKLGISSELGLGEEYKLNLNFDYGQLDGADSIGFNNEEVTTTSFGFGIRNNKFGASVNTDFFVEDDSESFIENSRLGFELDWHFSDETTISLGSKKRFNKDSSSNNSSSFESMTGNVQYIKFQHNL
ncbi:MAG TPA: hypothetical protein PK055_02510 [Gammaproteobacteria bacterium]|nr:hypothetical protein [Xanthomonadales bacterium]HOP22318.1 hypothetical protein [Gammaproteobacteria bacterium]HPI94918.1 hypothetical protein [Gammaproteobacteria bacterium]HPQ86511.1 hypothetical protein [Gammaproteobacteria bacterium]